MLKARVITALALLACLLAALFWLPSAGWMACAGLVASLGAWEWGGLIKLDRPARVASACGAGALCLALAVWVFDAGGSTRNLPVLAGIFALSAIFWLFAVPVWLRAQWSLPRTWGGVLIGWLVLVPACLALIQLRALSPVTLLVVMAAVWAADIAAYFCGRAFGQHKLAPSISPGKTWEGVAGGVIGVQAYGFVAAGLGGKLASATVAGVAAWSAALFALTAMSVVGDLFESFAKRQSGVKDSGNLLPGHGGILDRIDSLSSTLPLVAVALLLSEGRLP